MSSDETSKGLELPNDKIERVRQDLKVQLHGVVDVMMDRVETPEQMFQLRDTVVAINGLLGRMKGPGSNA